MAGKTIKIEPGTCSPATITVDPYIVRIQGNTKLKFKNDLVAAVPSIDSPIAKITFYDINDKDGTAYDEFCEGFSGTEFPVSPGGGPEQCTPTTSGYFAYTVTAENYQDLDPVLIIEPHMGLMKQSSQTSDAPDLVVPGLALLIGLTMGYFFARK